MIIVNFKTYREATGSNAVRLAEICEQVAKKTGAGITVAAQAADVRSVADFVSIPVFAQHIDAVDYGAHTGATLAEALHEAGASGSLINHSEQRLELRQVDACVKKLKSLGMTSVACAANDEEGMNIARFGPDYIAVEPPELIGGAVSVSTAKPELISNSVKKIRCNVLVGAGIKNGNDVAIAKKLGARGILVASGIVKAASPERALTELAEAMK
ncbi:MAG: triose-phosphate isomerase [Candidatus Aenigmarchaeota archaeon]|nr:triose-phosphate isomerase [Candidatus Aenigmarchaeota archaeon]